MAVDILQMLIEILQISPQLVNEYAAQGPIYQLFFLFFFPMVFIVLLIYIIMQRFSDNRGLSILVGIAVLAFIVLQGFYTFFAYLSRFWIFILVVVGFVWMWFYHKEKGSGGGSKARISGKGKVSGGAIDYIESLTGKKVNPLSATRLKHELDRMIEYVTGEVKMLREEVKRAKDSRELPGVKSELGNREALLNKLKRYKKEKNYKDFERWLKDYQRLDIT